MVIKSKTYNNMELKKSYWFIQFSSPEGIMYYDRGSYINTPDFCTLAFKEKEGAEEAIKAITKEYPNDYPKMKAVKFGLYVGEKWMHEIK